MVVGNSVRRIDSLDGFTVGELIKVLQTIENKELPVMLDDEDGIPTIQSQTVEVYPEMINIW